MGKLRVRAWMTAGLALAALAVAWGGPVTLSGAGAQPREAVRPAPPLPPGLPPGLPPCWETMPMDRGLLSIQSPMASPGLSPLPPPPPAPPPPPSSPVIAAERSAAGLSTRPAPYPAPYPAPQTRDQFEDFDPNPVQITALNPVSTFSIDVDTAAYAIARRDLSCGRLPPTDAVRIEEMINYFDYGYAGPASAQEPFATHVAVTDSPWAPGRQIIRIGLQGYDLVPTERPPLNLVLLLDVSGSMASADKLPLAIEAFRGLVQELTAQDRVAIVVYAGAAGAVLNPTPGDRREEIDAALRRLQAGGSTAGGQGLALAYTLARQNFDPNAVNRIILMTDGDFNVGVTDNQRLEDFVARQRNTGVYLSVLGFGRGNLNDALMQTLAQNGNGNAGYIDSLAEARRFLVEDLARNLFPIANDVKIQVEFNPARVAEYRLIGYESRLLRREDFTNDQVDAGEVGAGASVTALYEITPVGGPTQTEPLRYAAAPPTAEDLDPAAEFGFLRVRYKLPGEDQSTEITRAITAADVSPLAQAPQSARFAIAVAGFAQVLRGDPYTAADFDYAAARRLAAGAMNPADPGPPQEFLALVEAAAAAQAARAPAP